MSERKKYKRDHPLATALNFGEYEAVKELLDIEVPLPADDSPEDDGSISMSGRLRLLLIKLCRDRKIPIKLSTTSRLPSFPKHSGVFKTRAEENAYNRVYRQVWEQRQAIVESSPEIQKKTAEIMNRIREQQEARDRMLAAESNEVFFDSDDEPLPTDREVLDNATLSDEPFTPLPRPVESDIDEKFHEHDVVLDNFSDTAECWCSDPLDPEVHALHSEPDNLGPTGE